MQSSGKLGSSCTKLPFTLWVTFFFVRFFGFTTVWDDDDSMTLSSKLRVMQSSQLVAFWITQHRSNGDAWFPLSLFILKHCSFIITSYSLCTVEPFPLFTISTRKGCTTTSRFLVYDRSFPAALTSIAWQTTSGSNSPVGWVH